MNFSSFVAVPALVFGAMHWPVSLQSDSIESNARSEDSRSDESFSLVESLDLASDSADSMYVPILLDDGWHELELARCSVRAPGFRLFTQGVDGNLVQTTPPPVTTFRGTVDADPGSRVYAQVLHGRLLASVRLPSGALWEIQPVTPPITPSTSGAYAVRRVGVTTSPATPPSTVPVSSGGSSMSPMTTTLKIAQLGIEAEWRYTRTIGGVSATTSKIEGIVNQANLRFESQLGVQHQISILVIRNDQATDPYTQFDASGSAQSMLTFFKDSWNSTRALGAWDIGILYHHKPNLTPTSSLSFEASVCDPNASFSLIAGSQSEDPLYPFGFLHEVGHVFGGCHYSCANHAPCGDCSIMCAAGTGSTNYCNCELQDMQPVTDAAACLTTTLSSTPPTLNQPAASQVQAPSSVYPLVLEGTNLLDTQYVALIIGVQETVFRTGITPMDSTHVKIETPLPSTFGSFAIAVGNSVGRSNTITLQYAATTPSTLVSPVKIRVPSFFTWNLYGSVGAICELRAAVDDASTVSINGFQVLAHYGFVHRTNIVLDSLGMSNQAKNVSVGSLSLGQHFYTQFEVYDPSGTNIVAVSNITDTYVYDLSGPTCN